MSNYPPGVTGNEPEIAGYDEYEFSCPSCGEHDLTFTGTKWDAAADCPECGEVSLSPAEIYELEAAERAGDARRDGDD